MKKLTVIAVVVAAALAGPATTLLAIAPAMGAAASSATGAHWCRQGDPPIYASARTGCALAGKIVTGYVTVCKQSRVCRMDVYLRRLHRHDRIHCRRVGTHLSGTVSCRDTTASGIWARFSAVI